MFALSVTKVFASVSPFISAETYAAEVNNGTVFKTSRIPLMSFPWWENCPNKGINEATQRRLGLWSVQLLNPWNIDLLNLFIGAKFNSLGGLLHNFYTLYLFWWYLIWCVTVKTVIQWMWLNPIFLFTSQHFCLLAKLFLGEILLVPTCSLWSQRADKSCIR